MPREDTSDDAAPASKAVEKVRLFIIMIKARSKGLEAPTGGEPQSLLRTQRRVITRCANVAIKDR